MTNREGGAPEASRTEIFQYPEAKELHEEMRAKEIIEYVLKGGFSAFFHPHDALEGRTAIPFIYEEGDTPIVLVLGDNGSGKSFFRRMIETACHKGGKGGSEGRLPSPPGEFPAHVSVFSPEHRMDPQDGFKALKYGDERNTSTGANSSKSLTQQIAATRKLCTELDSKKTAISDVIVYFDEPDLGVGRRAAAGIGDEIAMFLKEPPKAVKAFFLTTHSPEVVREAIKDIPGKPNYVFLGNSEGPKTLEEWFQQQSKAVIPISCDELQRISSQRRRDITTIEKDGDEKDKQQQALRVKNLRIEGKLTELNTPAEKDFVSKNPALDLRMAMEKLDSSLPSGSHFPEADFFNPGTRIQITQGNPEFIAPFKKLVEKLDKRLVDGAIINKLRAILFSDLYKDDKNKGAELIEQFLALLSPDRFTSMVGENKYMYLFDPQMLLRVAHTLLEKVRKLQVDITNKFGSHDREEKMQQFKTVESNLVSLLPKIEKEIENGTT